MAIQKDRFAELEKKFKNFNKQEEEKAEADAENLRQVQAKQKEFARRRQEWIAQQEPRAKKAVLVIWKWYQKFTCSDELTKLVSTLPKERKGVRLFLTENLPCLVPKFGRFTTTTWCLSFDLPKKELMAHHMVKYGRSHKINSANDLLEYVPFPILSDIAETIEDGSIWKTISIKG